MTRRASRRKPYNQHPRYVNREFSWLQFNWRVLSEAENEDNPLLERAKFLAIHESNLDEFYMVRVSGLYEQVENNITETTPDGLTPAEQIEMVAETAEPMRHHAAQIWQKKLKPALQKEGITIRKFRQLSQKSREELTKFFHDEVFPLCTPLLMHPAPSFPFISNRSLNLAVELDDEGRLKVARIKVPPVLPRLLPVPEKPGHFVMLEDLIASHSQDLFPGVEVVATHLFRVIRDADIEIKELEAADLIQAVEQTLRLRRFGDPVLLEVSKGDSGEWLDILRNGLNLGERETFEVDGMLGFDALWQLADLDRPDLKFPPHRPFLHHNLASYEEIFETVKEQDVMVYHPFDSFDSVREFVASSALDDKVIGIKQSLYRAGSKSPLIDSMLEAAEKGKQVAVMVELKARFDESNNLVWSRTLERAGVHVTYGFANMKTHCKLCLVVRREKDGIRSYAHIGTGNYNPSTARLYTDLGLFTCDPEICQDVAELFNVLTGVSKNTKYRKLLVAPVNLRDEILRRIHREREQHEKSGEGYMAIKVNSLVDPEVIDALYKASMAGVKIDLLVRGICCLRPGVKGLSETIRVRSVVGRFLEHCRIYYFHNQGEPEAYIGSADMMRRNLDRRVEALAPVQDPKIIEELRKQFDVYMRDNTNSWVAKPDGYYERVQRSPGEHRFTAQYHLMDHPLSRDLLPVEKEPPEPVELSAYWGEPTE
jgi:polyphosphate kinase